MASQDEDKQKFPSEEIVTSETKWLWPFKDRFGSPKEPSS